LTLSLRSGTLKEREQYAISFALTHRAIRDQAFAAIQRVLKMDGAIRGAAIAALSKMRSEYPVSRLLRHFGQHPQAISKALGVMVRSSDADLLRKFLRKRNLRYSGGPLTNIFLALLKAGSSGDVRFCLEFIAAAKLGVELRDMQALAAAMCDRADASLKEWLLRLADSPEFWDYLQERPANALPVRRPENLYPFNRLSGCVLASLCDRSDWPILKRLFFLRSWLTKVAGAYAISKFVSSRELDELVSEARLKTGNEPDPGIVEGLRILDETLYGGGTKENARLA